MQPSQKVVRRRRATLAAFVVVSLVMLTAYFGESSGGVFHTFQRGAQSAFAPIESGAGQALKPARDLVGWVGDTIDAKGENSDLRDEVASLRERLGENQTAVRDNQQLRGLVGLRRAEGFPRGTEPVAARVIARSPTVWYATLKINEGSSDGLRKDDPVIADGGLIGKLSSVSGGTSEVTLITDASSAVAAQIMPEGAAGVVKPEVGKPTDLLLDFVQRGKRVTEGTTVVTSGFRSDRVQSLFPRGIPIGRVTRVDPGEVELYQRVHIKPFADLRSVDYVQVLTKRGQQSAATGAGGDSAAAATP